MAASIVHRNGRPVAGFDVGGVGSALWSPEWRTPGAKLAAMRRLVAEGRGDQLVEGGGCTEPGGGIVPTQQTAREMAARLERASGGGDLGGSDSLPAHLSAWQFAVVTSAVGAVTGWVLDEVARRTFRRKR